jgi:regulator of RNase E activity RraA
MDMMHLLQRARTELYSAVLSDVLDDLGDFHHVMKPHIRPLDESLKIVGFARTGMYQEVEGCAPDHNPYAIEIGLIDSVSQDDVLVLGCGNSDKIAPWGELLSTTAQVRGASGCITDGMVRDILKIKAMDFGVFHGGIAPLDSKGRGEMFEIDTEIMCGGTRVDSGDLIFGDADGVVVIPKAMIVEVLENAFEKVSKENATRDDLRAGKSLAVTFKKYGVL